MTHTDRARTTVTAVLVVTLVASLLAGAGVVTEGTSTGAFVTDGTDDAGLLAQEPRDAEPQAVDTPDDGRPAEGGQSTADAGDGTNASSGETLSSAVAIHGAELKGDVDRRSLEAALQRAEDDRERAERLSESRVEIERRIDRLVDRRERLSAGLEAGNVSHAEYRVRTAVLAAEAIQIRRLLETVGDGSRALADPLRETYALDEASLNRSLTRVDATVEVEFEAPLEPGLEDAPGDTDARTDVRNDTADAVEDARATHGNLTDRLDAVAEDADPSAITCGREYLSAADAALDRARDSLAGGHHALAEAALVDARRNLRTARNCVQAAEESAETPDWDDDGSGSGDDGTGSESGTDTDGVDSSNTTWNGTEFGTDDSEWDDDVGGDGGT